ncbi:MAG: hypothetical protein ACXWM6_06355, partial [Thermodesulfobacteriota bacterium]
MKRDETKKYNVFRLISKRRIPNGICLKIPLELPKKVYCFLPELVILESCPAIQAFKPKSIFRSLKIHYFSLKNTILTPFHLSNDVNNLKRKRITPEITGK